MRFKKKILTSFLGLTLMLSGMGIASMPANEPIEIHAEAKTDYSIIKSNGRIEKSLGKANFSKAEMKQARKSYERYSKLDKYGRAQTAKASISKSTMPKKSEKRGSISKIKPSGWQSTKYKSIKGQYLYNRSHLIGWQLSAENANKYNLITGTRQLNTAMIKYEDKIANYVNKTKKHVIYRVTPYYRGKEKVARTVRLEAKSVEDNGKGIDFDVLIFNEQKGVTINYANGKSKGKGQMSTTAKKSTTKPTLKQVWITATGKKYHRISKCGNTKCSKKLSLTEAKRLHLTSCKKCYK